MFLLLFVFSLVLGSTFAIYDSKEFQAFDDSHLFKLSWEKIDLIKKETLADEGQVAPLLEQESLDPFAGQEALRMKTANNEEYLCYLPKEKEASKDEMLDYNGLNPIQLIAPLMIQMACSYKIESYWTYELCHGRYLRQYHEERDSKKPKIQEYVLGNFDKERFDQLGVKYEESSVSRQKVPVRKIDSLSLPYLAIDMDGGTECDLSGKARSTKVIYVCHLPGKHEIYSIEEVSICEYEVVILTPLLCQHPLYKPIDSGEQKITCTPVDDSPKRPVSLMELESESLLLRHQNILESFGLGDSNIQIELRAVGPKDSEELITLFTTKAKKTPIHPSSVEDKSSSTPGSAENIPAASPVFDQKLIEDFLNGEHCLYGGTGWWRYEFCYGKKVDQYHEEADGTKSVVHLGYFNREKHLKWLETHPQKRPKPVGSRKQVSLYFTEGSVCDITKQPRSVEVKLKCKEPGATQNAISLYLLEPQPCEYVLGVEASFLCPLILEADEKGEIDVQQVLQKRTEL